MPFGHFTSFAKAVGHLIVKYNRQNNADSVPTAPVPPVVCRLYGILEGYAAIPNLYPHPEPFPGIILSHLEDSDGLIPECMDITYTIKAPPALVKAVLHRGEKIVIDVLISIKPPGIESSSEWSTLFHQDNNTYFLGFVGSVYFKKVS